MQIEGSGALVVGGASGLGAATARALCERGAKVVIAAAVGGGLLVLGAGLAIWWRRRYLSARYASWARTDHSAASQSTGSTSA